MGYENVLVEKDGSVAIVTLNRPQQLNALSYGLVKDLCLAMESLDQDDEVRAIQDHLMNLSAVVFHIEIASTTSPSLSSQRLAVTLWAAVVSLP